MSYEKEQINTALNRACDEVQELVRENGLRDDELPIDATNLVVNAGMHYLDHPDATLRQAIENNYSEVGWLGVEA